jgi:hypothetical protein
MSKEVSLIDRVRKVNADSKSAGKRYVILWAECVQHMFGDSHDWSVLATLIGGANAKDAAVLRALTGKAIRGWKLAKDDKQNSGLRFTKIVGEVQGWDEGFVAKVKNMGELGMVLHSKDIAAEYKKPAADRSESEKLEAHKKSFAKWAEDMDVSMEVLFHMLTAKETAKLAA